MAVRVQVSSQVPKKQGLAEISVSPLFFVFEYILCRTIYLSVSIWPSCVAILSPIRYIYGVILTQTNGGCHVSTKINWTSFRTGPGECLYNHRTSCRTCGGNDEPVPCPGGPWKSQFHHRKRTPNRFESEVCWSFFWCFDQSTGTFSSPCQSDKKL